MSNRPSLAQQIAELDITKPVDFDPEDVLMHDRGVGSDDEDDRDDAGVSAGAGREHYVDVGPSAIRRELEGIDDPKYSSVKVTRKQLTEQNEGAMDDEEDDEDEGVFGNANSDAGEDEEEPDVNEFRPQLETLQESQDPRSSRPQPPPSEQDVTPEPTAPPEGHDITAALRLKREDDREKGKAISRQLALYDALLDARIRLQKGVTCTNKLPPASKVWEITETTPVRECLNKMLREASLLSEDLFNLQELLLTSNEGLQPPPRKKQRFDTHPPVEGDITEWQEEVDQATADFSTLEHATHAHTLRTLHKWSSKVLAISPNLLMSSHRPTFSSKSSQNQKAKGAVQLVDEVLSDLDKLRARTRILRTGRELTAATTAAGVEENETEGREIFDDADFYQGLLRDVIASRTEGAEQEGWLIEQKRRRKEKKKVVDTKASKGRKLRYEVHEKLQNFMVPVSFVRGGWHEEQIDELFASLLGKGVEGGPERKDETRMVLEEKIVADAVKAGFRIFG